MLRKVQALVVLFATLAVAGCISLPGRGNAPPASPPVPGGAAAASGQVFGGGEVRVAMLLPTSGSGNAGTTGQAFRNAAELAMRDFPNTGIELVIYDTSGTPTGAQAAAGRALGEGAEIILGPVFATEVAAVAPQARQAGVPMVAFSSDSSLAGSGVYLLSFPPADDVNRIVTYAAQKGRRSFAALLPANAYGAVVEAAFREAVARTGGRVALIESYGDTADMQAKAAAVGAAGSTFDALLVPDVPDRVLALAPMLASAGVTPASKMFLGSGQWGDPNDPRVPNSAALAGAVFPAPVMQGYEAFAQRYRTAYGSAPPRNTTLAYDATVLAAGLVRQFGDDPFTTAIIGNPNGFSGIDGVFRFGPSGTTERRLAVYEVTGSGTRVAEPAARSFASGS
nr:penicillin-binding protein activator [Propylenella binzhouense]